MQWKQVGTLAAVCALSVCGPVMEANGAFVVVAKIANSVQDGPSHVSQTNAYFTARGFTTASSAVVNFGTGGSIGLKPSTDSPNQLVYDAYFQTLAQANAAFPYGSLYTFSFSDGPDASQPLSISTAGITGVLVPALTSDSYARVQGLQADQANTITLNNFAAPANATSVTKYVYVYQDGQIVYSVPDLNASSTSFTLPAGTLQANKSYSFAMDIDLRYASAPGFIDSEGMTTVPFNTAVPEPAAVMGVVGLSAMLLRRRPVSRAAR